MEHEWTLVNKSARYKGEVALGPEEVIAWIALKDGDEERAYREVRDYIAWWNEGASRSVWRDPDVVAGNVIRNAKHWIDHPDTFSIEYDWRQSAPVKYAERHGKEGRQ